MELPSARPRRVVLVEGNRDGTVGGSFQCLHDIARHLARSRYEPVAVFWEANRFADQLQRDGIEVHLWRQMFPDEGELGRDRSLAARGSRFVKAITARRRFLRSVRASVVHLNNTPEIGYDDWLPAARMLGMPIVAHARAEAGAGARLGPIARRLAGRFDRTIAISGHVAETLRRAGTPERRVVQIYDGIDIDALRAAATGPAGQTRSALGVPPGAFLILMAGNLKPWKGQHVLLEALARLPPAVRERCQVALAGAVPVDGRSYEAELRALVAQRGLTDRVHLLGPRSDVPALMHAADVVVHASIRPEPFGLVVVEAMALGKPIVASRLGGPAETVTPGSGLLFDPGDPGELAQILQRLLEDEPLRHALASHGRERAEQFSIHRNVAAIQALYDDVLHLGQGESRPG